MTRWGEFDCLMSHLTIFQSYMWRHIDVQADKRRSWTYARAPNAIDISLGSLTCPSKHRHGILPFYGYSEKPPHFSRLLRHAWGYGGHILDWTPGGAAMTTQHTPLEVIKATTRATNFDLYLTWVNETYPMFYDVAGDMTIARVHKGYGS